MHTHRDGHTHTYISVRTLSHIHIPYRAAMCSCALFDEHLYIVFEKANKYRRLHADDDAFWNIFIYCIYEGILYKLVIIQTISRSALFCLHGVCVCVCSPLVLCAMRNTFNIFDLLLRTSYILIHTLVYIFVMCVMCCMCI